MIVIQEVVKLLCIQQYGHDAQKFVPLKDSIS